MELSDAGIGLVGAIIGALATVLGQLLTYLLAQMRQEALDRPRKKMLKQMLENPPAGKEWRKMETLSGVIGADRNEAARLLIAVGARGSEREADVWALMSRKPLPLVGDD